MLRPWTRRRMMRMAKAKKVKAVVKPYGITRIDDPDTFRPSDEKPFAAELSIVYESPFVSAIESADDEQDQA